MTESREPRYPSVFDAWDTLQPSDWRSAVSSIVDGILCELPALNEQHNRFQAAVMKVEPTALSNELDTADSELRWIGIMLGAVLGWSLRETWTGRLEDLGTWAERARAY